MIIAMAALIGGGFFWVLTQASLQTWGQAAIRELDRLASWSGFGIDQVTLRGHRFTPDSDVFEALNLDQARSIVSFDIVAAREAVEELAWIEHAAITRVYPDQLLVEITERAPFALWQKGDDLLIVDREGRVLSGADRRTAPEGLLEIAGDGAATEATGLMALLSGYPEISQALQLAERVAERRWRLHLQGGSRIELPATGAAAALADLKAWAGFASLLSEGHSIIDVRAAGRIAIRKVDEAAGTGTEARGHS
jgi:cell division protein FtsQ